MFVDQAKISVRGGTGGRGCVSFRREKYVPKGGPDGGDGGPGGDVILRASKHEQSLVAFHYMPHFEGKDGAHGKGKGQHGRRGEPKILDVPVGTRVTDQESHELIVDLCTDGQEQVVAHGGKGGRGNSRFVTSTRQAPRTADPGEEGEVRALELELKVLADVGMVGYPNAGKSTLLTAVSDAHPKTAAYPFTTRHPVVGVVEFPDYHRFTVADIPGLIDGAHENVGLGHEFLRHIERARVLLYVLDAAGIDGRKPWDDFAALRRELELYQESLAHRPFLVVANKVDLPAARENMARLRQELAMPILAISAVHGKNVQRLASRLRDKLAELDREEAGDEETPESEVGPGNVIVCVDETT